MYFQISSIPFSNFWKVSEWRWVKPCLDVSIGGPCIGARLMGSGPRSPQSLQRCDLPVHELKDPEPKEVVKSLGAHDSE